EPGSVQVAVRNDGERDVVITGITTPDGVLIDAPATPLTLAPGEASTLSLALAVGTDRVVDGDLVVVTATRDAASFPLALRGEVTPWVLREPEERPDVVAALEAEITRQGLVGLGVGVARGDTI